ncbi:protein scarlet-like isoform X2 [Zootermopsis nevadensis]|uniref:Protein scarlet n=1 Tax=Zootermopsis nevadensis TaxID=136037 RepID=A0A067RUR8_ZOONE|nr:protein scarlet-like isoform X2 [Zootermopsis nevadensis]XP_021931555.1 protein scarlet-like isoform X2 [Zootermopsis nevadensis]XP_021931564.1 protein scarlet-like isoform X2 [Zootermopsis nevadensis]XP_021931572.1 protein scarlet-like isoform X2 [Zootermopsis nevadensis]XP_021931581.1 protein scarlet-like isoform X2 [Zootermopsis nevadensis]XP_021931589.1 protein scarlet-like isoform X2 [Zootermopsis nevadensis]XP_021931598.1 protein scarlet-like isoform X2 [Zootermopsis nevadensis]XP_0
MEHSCPVEMSESVTRFVEMSPLLGNQEYNLTLSWQNVAVKVKRTNVVHDSTRTWLRKFVSWKKAEEVTILDNVSGKVQSGSLVAVMGSSGCGKTSLLAAVSGRIKGTVTGEVLLCGHPVDGALLTRISGFVPQKGIIFETLTAKEHLQFMSWMRLDRGLRSDIRSKWIQDLLLDLNLSGCEDTPISALSGGERKRLSLAVELLIDPPLLFCDEPTTGLDSYNASTVVEKLNHLASRGKAVLCSIHQPTSDILSCFHKMILLSAGRVAFQGTLEHAYTFFSNQGFVCPPSYNPAEFFIQKLSVIPGEEEDSSQRMNQICEAFSTLEQDRSLQLSVPHIQVARNCITGLSRDFQKYVTIRKPYWHTQVYWLTWRSVVDSSHNKCSHIVQIAVFLVTSLMLSLCFMNTEAGTQSWIQDIRGLLYLITSEVFFTSAYSVFNTFPQEIPIFLRESELYSASAYYFSKMITLIPRAVIEPILYLVIIFGVVDFSRGDLNMFFLMAVPVVIVSNSATAYGCMLSAVFESPAMASVAAVPIDLISFIMAGIFYNVRALPASITWMKYLSQFYYSNEALAVVHWQEVDYIMCRNNTNLPCLENGQQVLDEYGFNTENLFRDLVVLAVFYIVLHFIGFLGVWRRSKRKAAY